MQHAEACTATFTMWTDSSGTENEGPIVAAVGVVSSIRHWGAFDRHFMKTVRKYGVSTLHMREFAHFKGEFASWKGDDLRRAAFLSELIRIAGSWIDRVFVRGIVVADYRQVNQRYRLTERFKGPYAITQAGCIGMAIDWGHRHSTRPRRDRFHAYVEEGDPGQDGLRKFLKAEWDLDPTFLPKTDQDTGEPFTPFCAADLIAYEHRKIYADALAAQKNPFALPWRRSLQGLRKHLTVDAAMYDCNALMRMCQRVNIPRR